MTNKAMFVPAATLSNKDALPIALIVAVIVHIILVVGMNFTPRPTESINKSIDITLINTPAKKAPEKAAFLAQENQLAANDETKKPEPPAQKPEPPAQEPPSQQHSQEIKPVKKTAPEESKPKAAQKIMTQQKAEKKAVTASKPAAVSQPEQQHQELTAESLQQQLTQLGTEIRHSRPSAEQARIKFVESVSAHKYIAAQYMKDWESKVERTGNLNYPEAATKKNFSGTLTMDVGINADGSIYSIRISKSSGIPELDEAAKGIVRMSAPFAELPLDLRKELDVLVITRVWKFSDESGLITR
jgi:protein TonB